MNPRLVAAASLLVNLVLVLLIWSSRAGAEIPDASPITRSPAPPPPIVIEPAEPQPAAVSPAPAPRPWPPFHWSDLADANYTNYVANLRRVGCPEETIGHIVRGATWTDLMRRIHAGAIKQHDLVYRFLADGEEGLKRIEEAFEPVEKAVKERERLLEALLGPATDTPADDMEGAAYRRRAEGSFPYVAPEGQALLALIDEQWLEKEAAVPTTNSSRRERARIRQELRDSKRAAQLEVLSTAEREEFERREWAMKNLDQFRTLSAVATSPEELRSLAALSIDELALKLGPQRMGNLKQISEVREARSASTAPEGISETKPYLTIHGSFPDLEQVARRFNLPPSAPRAALDILRSYEATLKTVHDDPDLLPRTRRDLIRGLEAERDRQMASVFGREAWETYRFHHGDW